MFYKYKFRSEIIEKTQCVYTYGRIKCFIFHMKNCEMFYAVETQKFSKESI